MKQASAAAEYAACAVMARQRWESLTALLSLGLLHTTCHVLTAWLKHEMPECLWCWMLRGGGEGGCRRLHLKNFIDRSH